MGTSKKIYIYVCVYLYIYILTSGLQYSFLCLVDMPKHTKKAGSDDRRDLFNLYSLIYVLPLV